MPSFYLYCMYVCACASVGIGSNSEIRSGSHKERGNVWLYVLLEWCAHYDKPCLYQSLK